MTRCATWRKPNQSDLLTEYDFQFDVDNRGKRIFAVRYYLWSRVEKSFMSCENALSFYVQPVTKRQENMVLTRPPFERSMLN